MSNYLTVIKTEVIDVVAQKIGSAVQQGALQLPLDYSADNALKSAFLMLQDMTTKDRVPVLQACDRASLFNALFNMQVQGLNPEKKQGYFIMYGNKIVWQRSYFGHMALAKRVNPNIGEIVAEVVYEDDVLKYKIHNGEKQIVNHEQALENIDGGAIIAAYCIVLSKHGEVIKTEIMTLSQIHQAWKQSRTSPVDNSGKVNPKSVHAKFPEVMCCKTVIGRACKPIINSSNDQSILADSIKATEQLCIEAENEVEYVEHANSEVIDIQTPEQAQETAPAEQAYIEPPTNEPVPEEPPPFDDNLTSAEVDQALMAEESVGHSGGPSF